MDASDKGFEDSVLKGLKVIEKMEEESSMFATKNCFIHPSEHSLAEAAANISQANPYPRWARLPDTVMAGQGTSANFCRN